MPYLANGKDITAGYANVPQVAPDGTPNPGWEHAVEVTQDELNRMVAAQRTAVEQRGSQLRRDHAREVHNHLFPPPKNVRLVEHDTENVLQWDAPDTAPSATLHGFVTQLALDGSPYGSDKENDPHTLTDTRAGKQAGHTYEYRVAAKYDNDLLSEWIYVTAS